jgi:hypothetical protein
LYKERIEKLIKEDNLPVLKLPKGTGMVVAKTLGIKPGPQLGKVMQKLNQLLIDGEINPDNIPEEVIRSCNE